MKHLKSAWEWIKDIPGFLRLMTALPRWWKTKNIRRVRQQRDVLLVVAAGLAAAAGYLGYEAVRQRTLAVGYRGQRYAFEASERVREQEDARRVGLTRNSRTATAIVDTAKQAIEILTPLIENWYFDDWGLLQVRNHLGLANLAAAEAIYSDDVMRRSRETQLVSFARDAMNAFELAELHLTQHPDSDSEASIYASGKSESLNLIARGKAKALCLIAVNSPLDSDARRVADAAIELARHRIADHDPIEDCRIIADYLRSVHTRYDETPDFKYRMESEPKTNGIPPTETARTPPSSPTNLKSISASDALLPQRKIMD